AIRKRSSRTSHRHRPSSHARTLARAPFPSVTAGSPREALLSTLGIVIDCHDFVIGAYVEALRNQAPSSPSRFASIVTRSRTPAAEGSLVLGPAGAARAPRFVRRHARAPSTVRCHRAQTLRRRLTYGSRSCFIAVP